MIMNLLQIVLSLIGNGIEIVMFFLVVRMILQWKSTQWFRSFDDAGKELVDGVSGFIDRGALRLWKRHLKPKSQLVFTFVLLEVCRAMVMQIYQCI